MHGLVDGDGGVDGDGARDEDGVREDAQTLNHYPLLVRNSAILPLERAQAPRPLALLLQGKNSYGQADVHSWKNKAVTKKLTCIGSRAQEKWRGGRWSWA